MHTRFELKQLVKYGIDFTREEWMFIDVAVLDKYRSREKCIEILTATMEKIFVSQPYAKLSIIEITETEIEV